MTKITTLVDDIYKVLQGEGGWNKTISSGMAMGVASMANSRFSKPQSREGIYLFRLSAHLVKENCGTK